MFIQFDAIVTDPPFGKRERAENFAENSSGSSSDSPSVIPVSLLPSLGSVECLGDPSAVLVTLFRVALQRLKLGGMLVFWLPTRAFTTAEEVREYVGNIQDTARPLNAGNDAGNASSMDGDTISHNSSRKDSRGVLQLERVTAEELNDNLWRWLCVLQLT